MQWIKSTDERARLCSLSCEYVFPDNFFLTFKSGRMVDPIVILMNDTKQSLSGRIELREVVLPDDQDFLIRLYISTRGDITALPIDQHQKNALLLMQYQAQSQSYALQFPNAVHYIVIFDGNCVGRYMIERKAGEILGIDLALFPESRSLGIGTSIIRSSFEEAAETGRIFVFHVLKSNRAVRLYLRLGCVIADDTATHYKMTWQPSKLMEKIMLEDLTKDDFVSRLNSTFQIYFTPEKAYEAELIEVSESRQRFRQEGFSLLFLSQQEAPFDQQMYKVEHPELGIFDLFLVPIGKSDKGVKYESVFNRLVE